MNSIIEAQEQFTEVFGELNIGHLCSNLVLPKFTREAMEMDEFIASHQEPAPIKIPVVITNEGDSKRYNFKYPKQYMFSQRFFNFQCLTEHKFKH